MKINMEIVKQRGIWWTRGEGNGVWAQGAQGPIRN